MKHSRHRNFGNFIVNLSSAIAAYSRFPKNEETVSSIKSKLHEEVFNIRQEENATYAINIKLHIIIHHTEENFNLERLKNSL